MSNGFFVSDNYDGGFLEDQYMNAQMDDTMDEHEERMLKVSSALGLFPTDDFDTAFHNACYRCNIDPEVFDEWDMDILRGVLE